MSEPRAPAPPESGAPLLSVIIPVFNEEETIAAAVRRVQAIEAELPGPLELIAVDDASTDSSRDLLRGMTGVRLLLHEKNQGKGAAIRTALAAATGRVVAIQDADLEYDPRDLLRLIRPILSGEARVVYGSRFLVGRPPMRWPNYVCNRLLAIAANALYRSGITDEATCYKLFDRDLLASLPLACRRFEFCPEVTALLGRRREKIVELPVSYEPRSYDSGKKIRWWDAVEAFWTLIRLRLRK